MHLACLVAIVCLIDCLELTFVVQLYIAVEAYDSVLSLDILGILVLIPSDQHVLIVIDRVHILYVGWLQANVIFVKELSLGFGLDPTSQTEQMIVRLLLPLEHLLSAGLKGLCTRTPCFPDHLGHLGLLCLEEFNLVVPGLFLVDNRGLLSVHLTLILKGLRLRFRCQHLSRCRRAKVYIVQLVLVLIFLAGQELQQAGVCFVGADRIW